MIETIAKSNNVIKESPWPLQTSIRNNITHALGDKIKFKKLMPCHA